MKLRNVLATAAFAAVISACGGAPASESSTVASSSDSVENAKVAAVLIYADWCGSCKVLDPKVKAVKAAHSGSTAFITLDYTDKDPDAFFAAADAAGVGSSIREYLGDNVKTGQLVLVGVNEGKVVEVIKKDKSEAEIRAAIASAEAL